jgi:hypothetical protein
VRVVILSNYPGQLLDTAGERLSQAQNYAYNLQVGQDQAQAEVRAARRAKPFWKRLLGVSTAEERAARSRIRELWQWQNYAQAHVYRAHVTVQQRAADVAGEDALTWGLSQLPDEWVLLRGYKNRRGEIDHILVGPLGIWAVEVKRRAVRVHINGDEWRWEKLHRYGNVVDAGLATDNSGRSWARQVNDPASALRAWLNKKGYRIPIHTAVMLMHERAQIGRIQHLTVDLLGAHPQQLVDAIWQQPPVLSPADCTKIVELIQRDHRYHAKK